LERLIDTKDVKAVLIAMPSLRRSERQKIISFLEPYKVEVRSVPGVAELAQGKVKVNDLLEIDLSDLLGRESVKPNKQLFERNISNKVVMVTGAGGSIGSELCRQILLLKPRMLVLFEVSEPSLYQIDQELKVINEFNIEVCPILGTVTDKERTLKLCEYYGVQTIYHAAAYKHVPIVEYNSSQGIFNNTIGTMLLAEAAIASNVETFVLISTDKAVRPTNFMGASKRVAEMVLQAFAEQTHNTCFTMVRFGNVLDSSGSVIPLFKKQIKEGGPLTLTHPDIVRYFMMIPEAVGLVIQAGAMAEGGEVFVLDMGEPVRIYDLAVKMINLSGLELLDENNPEGDIEIHYTGLRPGEKLYEELLIDGKFSETENKLIMRTEEEMLPWDRLEPILTEIHNKGSYTNTKKLIELIKKIVPEFKTN
jgi:FlaA1/EpsC-like NDP-sugar epimerase